MDIKKLFVFLLLGLFMISFASALEFDNVKSYDDVAREVTVKNAFGLGADIGKAKLISPLNVVVGAGYQKVAEFEITSYMDYNEILKSIDFYNKNEKDWQDTKYSKTYDIKYKSYENVEVDDFEMICVDAIVEKDVKVIINATSNGTITKPQVCTNTNIGSHTEYKDVWSDKVGVSLQKDAKVTIGIFTNVEAGDYVEWIPKIFGVSVDEWATFQQSTAVGLISYYRMDGNLIDDIFSVHLVNNGSTNITGKINDGRDFDGSNDGVLRTSTGLRVGNEARSFNFWVYANSLAGANENPIISYGVGSTSQLNNIDINNGGSGQKLRFWGQGRDVSGDTTLNTGEWYMGTVTHNGTTTKIYLNGVEDGTTTQTLGTTLSNMTIGSAVLGVTAYSDVIMDEVGLWNRAITPTEITEIYASTIGLQNPRVENAWVDYDLNTDIYSYYTLNETTGATAGDLLINNHGSNSGMLLNQDGVIGTGYKSDGTSDHINLGRDLNSKTVWTLNMWVNAGSGQSGDTIFARRSGGEWAQEGIAQFQIYNDDQARYIIFNGGQKSYLSPDNFFTIDEWTMVTITVGSGGVIELFSNGISFGGNTVGDFNDDYTDWVIGSNTYSRTNTGYDEIIFFDKVLNTTEIQALYNYSSGLVFNSTGGSPIRSPTITGYNVSANYTTSGNKDFVYYASDDIELSNVSIYVDDVLTETNTDGTNNTNYTFTLSLDDGDYEIFGSATNNNSLTTNTNAINILIDAIAPVKSALNNFTNFLTETMPINSTWNYTTTDPAIDSCYYNTSEDATVNVITCNASTITEWQTAGNKSIQYCANDTFGNADCTTESIWVVQYTQTDNPDPSVEGLDTAFTLTLDATDIATTTATFNINGTQYTPVTTSATANQYIFTSTINIPATWGNTTGVLHDWYFNTSGSATGNTATENVTVYELATDNCITYTDVILNMFLYDEETTTEVNGTAGASVEIDLSIVSKTNSSITLDYHQEWTNESNPQVCIPANVLNDTSYGIDFTIGLSSTDHVWEFFYFDNGTLDATKVFDTQTSTLLYLMDLKTVDSTSFLFNYFDGNGLPVTDAIVHVYRRYIGEGAFREVERAKADNNGDTIVHLVEEDVIYYFIISQYGEILFTSSQYTALCQATPCTIQIEESEGGATFPIEWDLVDGGAYSISSSTTSRDVTLDYASTDAGTFNLTVYKYESDGTYTEIDTIAGSGTSGSVVLNVPQSAGNVSFFASVDKDDEFVNSEWVDFTGKASDRFGITLSLFIASLLVLCLGLMAVSEGGAVIFWVILGMALSGFLGLINLNLASGVSVIIFLICAGGLLIWKLTGGRK